MFIKVLKWIAIILFGIPCIFIVGFIVLELFGMNVNHYATTVQTNELKQTIISNIKGAKILDIYLETGNTSGTGNHVDMLTVLLIQTDEDYSVVQDMLKKQYQLDEWSFYVQKASDMKQSYEESTIPYFYNKLHIPEDIKKCYVIYLCQSAPFRNNIEGY